MTSCAFPPFFGRDLPKRSRVTGEVLERSSAAFLICRTCLREKPPHNTFDFKLDFILERRVGQNISGGSFVFGHKHPEIPADTFYFRRLSPEDEKIKMFLDFGVTFCGQPKSN